MAMKDWLDAETRIERAQQFSEMHRWPEALDELDAALAINPNDAAWHAQRGQILDQLERHEEAVEAYRAALSLNGGAVEIETALCIDLIRTGRYQEAVTRLEQVAKEQPDYEPAYCNRIAAYTRLGDHDMAEQMFYEAQNLTEDCPNCFHHIAESLACRGIFDRAVYCWQRALEIAPDYPMARQRIAEASWMQGQHEKAREHYLAAMRADPGSTELLSEFGDLLVEMDDLFGAATKFRQALDLEPEAIRPKVMLGLICSQQGDLEAAIRYMEAALAEDQHYPNLRSQLGEVELRRGNLYVALRHLSLAVEDDPDDGMARMALGNCLLQLGRPDEAVQHFTRMIELEPDLAGPHHNLAVCRFLQGEFEEGIAHCLEALRIEPENVLVLHKLTLAYLHLGRWREAAEARNRGLALDPEHAGLKSLPKSFWRARLKRSWQRVTGWFTLRF
jgi:tetratricopeptide (TPR) repeat protein